MSTDLAVRDGATLFAGATPREVIEAATEAATELHSVIEQHATSISGSVAASTSSSKGGRHAG